MAEFVQTMKDWRRMCKEYTVKDWRRMRKAHTEFNHECEGCPLENIAEYACGAIFEPEFADVVDWAKLEKIVDEWAAGHPAKVYPMWCEWLADKGVVDVARMPVDYSGGIITEIKPSGKMYAHIPADIAEKLGIEPKEE